MANREKFIQAYKSYTFQISEAAKKVELEYSRIQSEVKQYQIVVGALGSEVEKIFDNNKFVFQDTEVSNGTQKKEFYFEKTGDKTMTIPSGIEGYPDYGPFDIDPVYNKDDDFKNRKVDQEKLAQIYGHLFSGYTSPITFNSLGILDQKYKDFYPYDLGQALTNYLNDRPLIKGLKSLGSIFS